MRYLGAQAVPQTICVHLGVRIDTENFYHYSFILVVNLNHRHNQERLPCCSSCVFTSDHGQKVRRVQMSARKCDSRHSRAGLGGHLSDTT
jgi:hypothetical protein